MGGFGAWLQVAAAFVLYFNTWGVINMYGVFQTFYQSNLLEHQSASNISWVGSIQAFLIFLGGAVVGPFFDLGYLRLLLSLGTFSTCFGMMMTSICKTYWQFVLAQGVTVGIGFGCLFLPSVAIVSQYFTTKKAIAFGIVSTGGSIGGVLYPIIFRQLQPQIGFGWTVRTIAFIILVTQLVPLLGMRLRTPSSTKRHDFLDLTAFKSKPYLLFCIATFFGFMGIYVTFFYIQLFALEKTAINANLASYLLPIINAASTIGRLIPNFFADKTGPLNIQVPFAFILAVLCFGWIGIKSTAGSIVFCLLYGFFAGSFVSLPGVTIISLSPNLATIGIQLGMSFLIAGLGLLVGEPIAGAILRGHGGWIGLQVWCGVLLGLSGIFSLAARIAKVGTKWGAKA
ncbi:hypothetical protein HO173_001237 [Letharia columbiana]|uniref:Major facilitator superfamily (MFS) profile domain-containing protein n=1 Tax=Letharia columbiana TaxID=112416 RepID=A0A8H6G4X2_9LECA|nr:uncharacterized protein HO173_001237 [Letharia columbiana]KAF6240567.1 hypothetical protein HO173_001237 [Letharia columbiana]